MSLHCTETRGIYEGHCGVSCFLFNTERNICQTCSGLAPTVNDPGEGERAHKTFGMDISVSCFGFCTLAVGFLLSNARNCPFPRIQSHSSFEIVLRVIKQNTLKRRREKSNTTPDAAAHLCEEEFKPLRKCSPKI